MTVLITKSRGKRSSLIGSFINLMFLIGISTKNPIFRDYFSYRKQGVKVTSEKHGSD